jgi:hypothetical protein
MRLDGELLERYRHREDQAFVPFDRFAMRSVMPANRWGTC